MSGRTTLNNFQHSTFISDMFVSVRGRRAKQGVGRFINRQTKTGRKFYDRSFIYVPAEVGRDGTFPFKVGEKVNTKIQNKKLIIEKTKPLNE